MDPNFPSQIPFWIKVQGVPLHLWNEAVLRSIGEDLGTYETCEILQGTMRMRVHVNGLLPLLTTYTLELGNGVEITVKLVYEKLEKHCSRCLRLDHEAEDCPEAKVEKDVAQQRNHRQDSTNSNRVREAYTERREHDKRSTGAQNQCGYNPTRANSKNSHQTLGERHFPRDRRYESWSSKEHSREEAITKPYHRNQHAGDLFRNSREGERWVETGRRLHRSPPHREKTDTMERGRKSPSSHRGSRDADRNLSQSYRSKGAEISSESLHTPAANRGEFEGISEAIPEEVMAEAREELREVMIQYTSCADPTESAARKARVRKAEEQGEVEESTENIARQMMLKQKTPALLQADGKEHERVPATLRLGPSTAGVVTEEGTSEKDRIPVKKKLGRPPKQKLLGVMAATAGTRPVMKRKVTNNRASPKRKVSTRQSKPTSKKAALLAAEIPGSSAPAPTIKLIPASARQRKDFHNPRPPVP